LKEREDPPIDNVFGYFYNGFVKFYNGNGKKAGTYVFRGGGWGSSR
jgi:hypothetical protein